MFSSSRFRGQSSNGTSNNNANASSTNSSSSSTTANSNSTNNATQQQQRMNCDDSNNTSNSLANVTVNIGKCEPFGEIGIDTNCVDQTVKNISGLGLFY